MTTCKCGKHTFETKDIRPPLAKAPKGFYGGHVTRFSDAKCPFCCAAHTLWLRPTGQSWRVVEAKAVETAEPAAPVVEDQFTPMERLEVVAWLEANEIEFAPTVGTEKLKNKARAWLAEQEMGADEE